MSTSVFCTATEAQLEVIIGKLKAAGIPSRDISVLMANKGDTREFAIDNETKAPEGAVAGTGAGMFVGGGLGWLAGIGALAIPGLGPFIAAGPIMAALSGAAVGGVVGSLTGALIGMGIPEFEAKKYEGKVSSGSALISVHSEDDECTTRVKAIYERSNAQDITTAGEMAVPAGSRA
jgi:hypothetical protein